MKIKKVNELNDSKISGDELNKFRDERFNTKYDKQYELYGEYFSDGALKPQHALLYNSYDINNVIKWYNDFLKLNKSKYENFILTERNETLTMLDLDLLVTTTKYNL